MRKDLRQLILSIALALGSGSAALGASDPLAGWTFSNGHEFPGATGELRWNATEGHSKPGCAEVRYSFDKGGNYVATMMPLPPNNNARRVRLWLKKPGSNRITFRAADHTGQTFQKFVNYEYPGWQQIEVDLSQWVHSWGGSKDGKVRWPITAFGVLIENDGNARHGSYFIDGVEFLPAADGDSATGLRRSTYVASTFADGWYSHGPAGCELRTGVWTYALPSVGASAGLGTDLPLYGDPKRFRLTVLSDGSRNELSVTLGSHFQSFETALGTLSEKGRQTLEVPLDSLADWRHFGGENDGVRRLPLRLTHIGLARKGEQTRGEVKLLSLELETAYAPEHTVVLIPDGRLDGETAVFSVVLRNLAVTTTEGRLITEIRDVAGRVSVKETPLTLPAGAGPIRQTASSPMNDRAFLEGAFRFIAAGVQTPEVSATVTRLPEVPKTPAVNPIGVGMYLYRQQHNPQAVKTMTELADIAQRAGVKWTREEINWHITEPEKGRYDWRFYDDLVRVANGHGIQVYGLLAYWPNYAGSDKIIYTEAGAREYARWAAQVVRHYKDRIKHWEIWNEPNIFFWSGPKELYIETLKQAYAAIKQEDPEAKVLGCSTAGIDAAFIKKVVDAKAPFDILTIHPYRGSLEEQVFINELKRTQESVGGRPVWITEMGWPTCIGGTSERQQAGLVARTYLSALASGVIGSVSWYDFRDDGDNPFYNEHRFGLIRTDMRPKAGYRALATIGRLLARHEAAGAIDLGDDLLAFRFKAASEDVIAIWSSNEDRAVSLRTSPPARQAFDAMGQPLAVRDGRFNGMLPAGLPIYLIGPDGMNAAREPLSVKITAEPAIARPGEEVCIRIDATGDWRGPTWQLPIGWLPIEGKKGKEWGIRVPSDQPQGRVGATAEFEADGQRVRVPLTVTVQPAVIRL